MSNVYITGAGQRLVGVHDPSACEGRPCVIHNQSGHHMLDWPTIWIPRAMYRTCKHGFHHPDPDDLIYQDLIGNVGARLHLCDGCCHPPLAEWLGLLNQLPVLAS